MAASIDLEQTSQFWRLSAKGVLDYGECSEFRLSIHRILTSGPRAAIIDLGELSYLDSSALGVLLAMSKEYRSLGGQLVLVTNEGVDKILGILMIDRAFTTASSLADALEMIDARTTLPPANDLPENTGFSIPIDDP